jgi:cytochrome c2
MIPRYRTPLLPSLAAAALAAGLLVACTAQEPPAPAGGGDTPAGASAGTTGEKPAEPAAAAPVDRAAALLADPNLSQKAKLGRSLAQARCTMCHKVDGKGGVLSPPLEQVTAERFAKMGTYGKYLTELKAKDPARFNASKKLLEEIEADTNSQRRALRWFDAYLAKPTFDNGQAKMLKQVLSAEQTEQILAYLLTLAPKTAEEPAAQ